MIDLINKIINRINSFIVKALIKSVDDSDEIQLVKIDGLEDETIEGIERIQPYGLTSNPPIDSETIVLFLNGNREHGIAIACDSGVNRIKSLDSGEVAIYTKYGQIIKLGKEGNIEITLSGVVSVGNGSDYAAMNEKVKNQWNLLLTACQNFTPVPHDGGAALAAKIVSAITANEYGSTNLKAD